MAEQEIESNPIAKQHRRPKSYNKPTRRQALLEIRRLIVEEGLSHNEIQLRLNLPPATYFRYLDMLFQAEQEAISGDHYTYQRLLNETLILNQRYLRRARKLTQIGDDPTVDPEQRIEAYNSAAEFERAAHDMAYMAPSYLRAQGLLPEPEKNFPTLSMSRISKTKGSEEPDPSEKERIKIAGEFRRQNIIQQQYQQSQEGHAQQQQQQQHYYNNQIPNSQKRVREARNTSPRNRRRAYKQRAL